MKVGIIGGSGIGRYHAQWFNKEGCEIVAFTGRTEESVQATDLVYKKIFNFRGKGYSDVQSMLNEETPDLVAVCTPPETHYSYALAALNSGANVFCEKPFLWGGKRETMMVQGKRLIDLAKKNNLLLGVNMQYAAALSSYDRFRKKISNTRDGISSFYFEMESTGSSGRVNYDDLWIEMAPHPLSMLQAWLPEGYIKNEDIICRIERKEVRAHFTFQSKEPCKVEIVCRHVNQEPVRRFGINGFIVECFGKKDGKHIYRTYLRHNNLEFECEDFMHQSIQKYIHAVQKKDECLMLATGELGYHNLLLQEQVYQHATKIRDDGEF